MAGMRAIGVGLCAWMLFFLPSGPVRAQVPGNQDAVLVSEAEAHERFFRYIDLPDLRDIQASLLVLRQQGGICPSECAAPDCAGLVAALGAADQTDVSLGQLAEELDHLHTLEVRHLASLQGEAVLAEDRYRGDAEILVYQRFLVEVAGHITSTVFVLEDVRALRAAGEAVEALNFAYALNELAGDMQSLTQGLSGRTGASPSGFDQELAILQSEIGNVANIAGGSDTQLNALSIIARRMVALGQAEMERRQAEVDALQREAYRERREVDQALTRTHALAVEAALLRSIAAEARETAAALARCAATCSVSMPRPERLRIFLQDPERGPTAERLDPSAVEQLRTLIARSGRQLREGWQPDCEPSPDGPVDAEASAVMAPPGPDAAAARSVCFGMSRVGAVQAFDTELQARLAPQMAQFMSSCTDWHEALQAWPQNLNNPAHGANVCEAECVMMGDYDRYILAQSPVAIEHVARLDAVDRARQRASIDAELRSLTVSLRLARRESNAPDGWRNWPDPDELEAGRARLLERREALDQPSLWAQGQTSYWRLGEAPQMLQCRSEDAIGQREAQCRAACGGAMARPAACVNPAPTWIGRLGEALYPPSHPQRSAFEDSVGGAESGPAMPLPGGVPRVPLPEPVPLIDPGVQPVPTKPDVPQ